MRNSILVRLFGTAVLIGIQSVATAADDSKTAREHELLHRAQQQLQQLQQENADLQRAKNDAESKLKTASDQLGASQSGARSAQARNAALSGDLKKAQDTQADLSAKLDETNRVLAAMTQKQVDTAARLAARETEVNNLNTALTQSRSSASSCEAKNEKLYQYGQVLLQRYENKGVWAAMTQKEPFVGTKEVDIQNTVQEYHDKLASERIQKP